MTIYAPIHYTGRSSTCVLNILTIKSRSCRLYDAVTAEQIRSDLPVS